MEVKNRKEEEKGKIELNSKQDETENTNYYGRSHNEAVAFTQVHFQTFQNILDKRNELLNTVKVNHNLNYI